MKWELKFFVASIFGILALVGSATSEGARPLKAPPNGRMPVRVVGLAKGRIRVERAGRKRVLDLAGEISGCIGSTFDPVEHKKYESEVDFEIVDETEQGALIYLVLLASAPPNCNVQGACGAAEPDSTLIWLKLARDLTLAGKQAFAFDSCATGKSAKIAEKREDELLAIQARELPWNGDVLQVEYQERLESRKESESPVWHLIFYDRANPDAGLQKKP
jgi:hypothetical protein